MKFNIKNRLVQLCLHHKTDELIIKKIKSHKFHNEELDLNYANDKLELLMNLKCSGCNIDGDILRKNVIDFIYSFANDTEILSCDEIIIKNLLE